MQTIKVTLPAAVAATETIRYQIDGVTIATVSPDAFNKGRYCGEFGALGSCNNADISAACDFISSAIYNHFAAFGLNVEFDNA